MKNLMSAASAAALIAFAYPAFSQDSLELTLDAYVAIIKAQGGQFDFSAKNVGSDGSVEYRDIKMSADGGAFGIDTQWLRATPAGDKVTLTFAPEMKVTVTPDGASEPSTVTVTSENLALTTNAIVPDPTVLEVVDVAMSADKFRVGDMTGNNPSIKDLNLEETNMVMNVTYDGPGQKVAGSWNADSLHAAYALSMDGMESSTDSTVEGLAMTVAFDIASEDSFPQFLTGEKNFSLKFDSKASSGTGSTTQEGVSFAYESKAGPATGILEAVGGLVNYSIRGGDATMVLTPQGMPMPPVNLAMKEIGMDLVLPFSAKDAPGEAKMGLKLGDLSIGEELWSMVDPGQTIARDPVNIDINLSGMVQVVGDVATAMSGENASAPTDVFHINDLQVNSFLISAAGASVKAGGGLTFNNDGPVPMPAGTINVEINGAQGLSQKLVDLGLIDAMQSGMFMGMVMSFAKPGAGADQFTSDIEFKEDGSVTANGQPLPM